MTTHINNLSETENLDDITENIENPTDNIESEHLLSKNSSQINISIPTDISRKNSVPIKKSNKERKSFIGNSINSILGITCLFITCLCIYKMITIPEEKYKIKVSIVIPTYNAAMFLDRSVGSAMNQTLKEIEIIVVNDCSTDNTTDVLKQYEKDSRVRIINQTKNGGASVTRNTGINLANGEFIGFIDSDDLVDPEYFEFLYSYSKGYDVIEGIFLSCTNLSDKCLHHDKYNPHGSIYDSIWRKTFLNYHNVRFGDKKTGEDIDFRNDCYKHNPKIKETPDKGIYYYYKRREGSLMNFNIGYLEKINNQAIEKDEKNRMSGN